MTEGAEPSAPGTDPGAPADEVPSEGATPSDGEARTRWWRRPGRRRTLTFAAIGLVSPVVLFALLVGVAYWRIQLPPEHLAAQSTLLCPADVTTGCDDTNAMAAFTGDQDRTNVKLADVSPTAIAAVLSTEDRSFYGHGGVDVSSTVRALWADIRGESTQGGSTITQQYVKNVYLASEAGNRSGLSGLTRKFKEAILAVKVEQQLSKQQILERYLNAIYFGRGAYGIGAAARVYFGRTAHDLDLAQSAFLAGLIRAPGTADPVDHPEEATKRRRVALDAMLDVGAIDKQAHDAADAQPWVVATLPDGSDGTVLPRAARSRVEVRRGAGTGTEYFIDVVRQQLLSAGFTESEIDGGGLRVYTTLDLKAQQEAWDAVTSTLDQPDDPAAALVTIDRDGAVRAMIGGRDHGADQVNLAMGTAGGGSGRQAGSAFKPFTLTAAVHGGIPLTERFPAPSRITIPGADAGKDWVVNNAEPSSGQLDLVSATALSSNTVYAQLVVKVGPDKVAAMAKSMGITSTLSAVPSITLGTADVSPYEMADGYSTLARGGEHVTPVVVTRVERPDGTTTTIPQQRTRAITADEAATVTSALRQVIEDGTGTGADPGVPAAGKTGTTEDHRDAWFVGYLPDGYTTAVWMGYENPPGAESRTMERVRGKAVYGGGLPAAIWKSFMTAAAANRNVGDFPPPPTTSTSMPPSTEPSSSTTTSTTAPPVATTSAPPGQEKKSTTTTTTPPTTVQQQATTTTPTTTVPVTTVPP